MSSWFSWIVGGGGAENSPKNNNNHSQGSNNSRASHLPFEIAPLPEFNPQRSKCSSTITDVLSATTGDGSTSKKTEQPQKQQMEEFVASPATEIVIQKRRSNLSPSNNDNNNHTSQQQQTQIIIIQHNGDRNQTPSSIVPSASQTTTQIDNNKNTNSNNQQHHHDAIQLPPSWRDESDPAFIPNSIGAFVKVKNRKACLTEEAAETERRQRQADAMSCHCALNLDGVVKFCTEKQEQEYLTELKNKKTSSHQTNFGNTLTVPSTRHHKRQSSSNFNTSQQNNNNSSSMNIVSNNNNNSSLSAVTLQITTRNTGLVAGSNLLPACRIHDIMHVLPVHCRELQWRMIFATEVDGFSIGGFYRKIENSGAKGACILLAEVVEILAHHKNNSKDTNNNDDEIEQQQPTIIGAFLSDPPTLAHGAHHFFGSQETFVFSFDDDLALLENRNQQQQQPEILNNSSLSSQLISDSSKAPETTPQHQNHQHHKKQKKRGQLRLHHHHNHHHHHHNSHPSNGSNIMINSTNSNGSLPIPAAEHFIVCSPNSIGIGGGEDGAAIHFMQDLQRGTSSVSCASFGHSPPLVGTARHVGIPHSEFKVHKLFLFALDDYVEYLLLKPPSSTATGNRKNGNNNDLERNGVFEDDDEEVFSKFSCKGCTFSSDRPMHHRCGFIHDQAVSLLKKQHQQELERQRKDLEANEKRKLKELNVQDPHTTTF